MAAQSGPGQPRGQLGAWITEARASSFHASIQAHAMANPVAVHADQAGPWAPHRVPAGMPAGPDSVVSPGKIFVSTLIGAAIPLAPLMLYWHYGLEELPLANARGELDLILSSIATLFTVPMAAGFAGVDSLGRTLVGTGLGFILATIASSNRDWARDFRVCPGPTRVRFDDSRGHHVRDYSLRRRATGSGVNRIRTAQQHRRESNDDHVTSIESSIAPVVGYSGMAGCASCGCGCAVGRRSATPFTRRLDGRGTGRPVSRLASGWHVGKPGQCTET